MLSRARKELKLWFAIDTLEFLRRGGRIGAASAWIGSTLKVKPILTVENEMTPVERVRTSSRAFERMVDYARQGHESGADAWCAQHINDPEAHARLVEAGREVFGTEPTVVERDRPRAGRAHGARAARHGRPAARVLPGPIAGPRRPGAAPESSRCATPPRGRSSGSC